MLTHITDTLLFYFLSTVAQTLVAVVAFVGLVAVWRLQQLGIEKSQARAALDPLLNQYVWNSRSIRKDFIATDEDVSTDFFAVHPEAKRHAEICHLVDWLIAEKKQETRHGTLVRERNRIKDAEAQSLEAIKSLKRLGVAGLVTTAYSLWLLLTVGWSPPTWVGIMSMAALLVGIAATFLFAWRSIAATLKEHRS